MSRFRAPRKAAIRPHRQLISVSFGIIKTTLATHVRYKENHSEVNMTSMRIKATLIIMVIIFVFTAVSFLFNPLINIHNGLLFPALLFLAICIFFSAIVSGIVIKPFQIIHAQAEKIRGEHELTMLFLDTMPLSGCLIDKNMNFFKCNEGTLRLFQLNDRQEFLDHFFNFSPEYQPDGQLSAKAAEKYIKQAFDEGKCVFEWLHITKDGTLLPTETTLVRVAYDYDFAVAGYVRDMREQKRMTGEIERNANLLSTVNEAAGILLRSENDDFAADLYHCMGMLAEAVDVDRVYIWKNHTVNGQLYCTQLYEWSGGAEPQQDTVYTIDISYSEMAPGWEETLSQGNCINGLVFDMQPELQAQLSPQSILAIFVAPVFVQDQFWGFVGYDNCHEERLFTESEQSILRSGGLLIANAILRNEMLSDIRDSSIKLEAALNDATRANDAKSSFLANMSHEMRTPLNAIIGLTDLEIENDRLDDESLTSLEKINDAGMTLLSTVNDILDISKIESGKFEIVPAQYNIPSLLNDTITQSIMHKGEKPIEFVLDMDGNMPAQLFGDELRIKQVLNNLLSNAFKYTKEGTIELGLCCVSNEGDKGDENRTVWLTAYVRDTGIGIQPEYLESIFEDYSQMDTQANRRIMGTGLGLSITKRMVELMKGTITVSSEYGKGSVFTVSIPQKCVNDSIIGQEIVNNLKNFHYYGQKRKQNAKLVRINLPYARVLVVDDVGTNLDVAKGLMKPYGMQIDCMTGGKQAIDAIRDEKVRYSAVFMDHMMPGMDGIEATRLIREIGTEYAKTVPIIALTANAVAGNEEMFLDKGFQDFISKPIEISRLDAVIRRWVRDKEREKLYLDRRLDMEGDDIPEIDTRNEIRSVRDRQEGFDRRLFEKLYYDINIKKGLKRFGGDMEVYLGILRSFAVNTKPLLEKVKLVKRENLNDYAISVHGIKGSCRGIFAKTAGEKAEALEIAANAGDFDFIGNNNPDFVKNIEKLIADLDEILEKIGDKNPKKKMATPDRETLTKLFAACIKYDMDETNAVMAELELYEYESNGEIVARLRKYADEADFARIIDELSYFGCSTL